MDEIFSLALDIGTSSVRAAVYDAAANVLPETFTKLERRLSETDDGGSEIDADEALDQVLAAIDSTLRRAGDRPLSIVAASSFWHSLMGIDAAGNPTTKVFAWSETRPAKYVPRLRSELDEASVHNRTGAHFHSSFWPAKLLWIKNELAAQYACTDRWISFSDFVHLRLTGRLSTSVSMASATGLFDIRQCDWDKELSAHLGLDESRLAPVADDDDRSDRLLPEFVRRWPALRAASVLPAIGDGAANNIGADCTTENRAALMIGTSGAMRVAFEGDVPGSIPEGLWCYRIDRRSVVLGGALSDGGGIFRWLKENLRLAGSDDDIEAEIAKRAPAAHGLAFLPFLFGERSTGYHENARGAVVGLRSTNDAVDILQAGLEAVAYRFAEIFERLGSAVRVDEIVASGGALRESPVWTQIIADALGHDLFLPETREASSRGAVINALGRFGVVPSSSQPAGTVFRFDGSNHRAHSEAREKHRNLYDLLAVRQDF